MTLRSPFPGQQLLFLLAAGWLSFAPGLRAQAPAANNAGAANAANAPQDVLILQDGRQQPGRVLGVSQAGVQVMIGQGTISLPLSSIKEVRMAVLPPEFAAAQRALAAKDYPAAQKALSALEKFHGLPAEWAQEASAMAGDLFIEMGQVDKAEAAYKDFQRLYPSAQGGAQAEVGMARLAVAKKDFASAKSKLEPIVAKGVTEKNVPPNLAYSYSQAFYLMGQIKEHEGDFTAALENYLRTVALFYSDRAAVSLAQEKADDLRKAHPEIFIP